MADAGWLWAVPLLAIAMLAWWGRGEVRQRRDGQLSRKYFTGLNYLLNEEQDKAIEVFLGIAEIDRDTVETHLALANLFRRRGEVDRAIRIHQNLIARPKLSSQQRLQATLGLGEDYMCAGLLDRAETLLTELAAGDTSLPAAYRHLISIYQQEKDWPKAIDFAFQLQRATGKNLASIIAQYYCEQAEDCMDKGQFEAAKDLILQALSKDPQCVRASIQQGRIADQVGDAEGALNAYQQVIDQDMEYLPEIIGDVVRCYQALGREEALLEMIAGVIQRYEGISPILSMAGLLLETEGRGVAADFLVQQLQRRPSVRGLEALIELNLGMEKGPAQQMMTILRDLTGKLLEGKSVYRCKKCGFGTRSLHWQCPGCKEWNSVKPIRGVAGE